jgi:hypothetical protein
MYHDYGNISDYYLRLMKTTVLNDANPIILRRRKLACGSQEKPVSSNPETLDCILQFFKPLRA